MAHDDPAAVLDALDDLLTRERAALLGGAVDSLSRFTAEKERLVAALESAEGPVDRSRWQAIRDRAGRNGRLMQAAIDGVRAAEQRVAELARARDSLETYGRDGTRRDLAAPRARHQRRA